MRIKNLILATAATVSAAHADCPSQVYKNDIKGGLEASVAGVPNYAQAEFPGGNDCGPVAAAMLLGYYDANGWPCMVPGSGPYYDGGMPQGVMDLVTDLRNEMPYSSTFGTPPSNGLDYNGKAVTRVAHWQDPGAAWTYDEDEIVSTNDIMDHINGQRPVLMCVRAFGSDAVWIDDGANSGTEKTVEWHWTTVLGYEKVKEYADVFGDCVDWLDDDEFYVIMRSGWRNGGDSRLRYHFGFWDDLYTVEIWPGGSPSCTDPQDEDGDGHATNSPVPGMTGGTDCDDSDPDVFPGQTEFCDGVDNNCNGMVDEGGALPPAPGGLDSDGDGIGNNCDICPYHYDPDQLDNDKDGQGDACDPDDDNDGCADEDDDKPFEAWSVIGTQLNPNCNPSQGPAMGWDGADSDGDGLLNCEDDDDDNDGILDGDDECPTTGADSCVFMGQTCPFIPIQPECLLGGCWFVLDIFDRVNPDPTRFEVQVVDDVLYLPTQGRDLTEAFAGRRGVSLTLHTERGALELGNFDQVEVVETRGATYLALQLGESLAIEPAEVVGEMTR